MIRNVLLVLSLLASAPLPSRAQSELTKEDLCPDWSEVDPLFDCLTVESYAELAEIIENAPSGSELTLCPFFLRKVTSVAPITVKKGIRALCARTDADQFCTVIGTGNHLVIDSAEDTLWQGFSFRGSNDHAVNVLGETENAEFATHTFCQTSFLENVRSKDSRGGALMLEKSSGTVNVAECFFQDNFSKTFGAAIYSRANQLNIIQSFFVKNRATGYGPALYMAIGGSLMIKTSLFLGNRGRDDHDVVFNPGNGTNIFEDGFGNSINDGDCRGVFNIAKESCIVFEKLSPTPFPTNRLTKVPTSLPTAKPTNKASQRATIKKLTNPPFPSPTVRPTENPTSRPKIVPTQTPTTKPSRNRTEVPTNIPTRKQIQKPTQGPTTKPTQNPTQAPTIKPTQNPTTTPTKVQTTQPSRNPSKKATIAPSLKPTPPPTLEPTIKPTIQSTPRPTSLGDIISKKCLFRALFKGSECIDVNSFQEFKLAIESGGNDVIFCGGFNLQKAEVGAVDVSNSIDIRCIDQCSFYGFGPFFNIGGISSKIRLENLKFVNSRDSSAVIVSTSTAAAQTTFCDTEFERNQILVDKSGLGGAITVSRGSGIVNVVNNTFIANIASQGGAIHSEGFKLNVVESRFVANNAYDEGNAIFVSNGNQLSVHSSTFILNTEVASRYSGRERPNSNFAIVVQPNTSIRASAQQASITDGGGNSLALSGKCNGVVTGQDYKCQEFKD